MLPVLLLLSVEAKSQAYTYVPFPDSSFTWQGRVTCHTGSHGGSYDNHWTFNLVGDTTLGGFTYHKLRKDSATYPSYIREDSTRKVYLYNGVTATDQLVFDFGVGIGDTANCAGAIYVVSSIDTINYNGILRRRLVMAYPANIYFGDVWIEGIGSLAGGPVGDKWHTFFCNPATSSSLCIARKDSVVIYGNYCPLQVGIETVQERSISFFPNPSITSFTLQLSTPPVTQTYFNLYDAFGRAVKREEIISETTTMQRNNLPSGIYFWQLQQGNKILDRGKVVME